jgi:hypothetical protein
MQGLLAAGLYKDYQRQGDARIISSRVVQGLSAAGDAKIISSRVIQGLSAVGLWKNHQLQ